MKLPQREEQKIAQSTAPPEWNAILANGGYTVHPVPAPNSTHELNKRSTSAGGRSQKLMLFNRGKPYQALQSLMEAFSYQILQS